MLVSRHTAERHDEKHQPEIKDGRNLGMPLGQFTEEAYQALAGGKEEIPVGNGKEWYDKFEVSRQECFQGMIQAMSGT